MKTNFESALTQAYKQGRFLKDPSLEKYRQDNLKEYIEWCCEQNFLIEAYTLIIQYTDHTIALISGTEDVESPTVFRVLRNIEKIDNKFFLLYRHLSGMKNNLTHKILKNPEMRKQLANDKNHKENLILLITMVENFTLINFKKTFTKYSSGKDEDKKRLNLLIDLMAAITKAKVLSIVEVDEDKEIYRQKLKDKIKDMFYNPEKYVEKL